MVFVYRGRVERLAREVEEVRDVVNEKYLELFGEERYKKLEEAVEKLLIPEIFFDDVKDIERFFGGKYSTTRPSALLNGTDVRPELYDNGRIKDNKGSVGVGFYVSEESFKRSGAFNFTDRIVATYIHEFIGSMKKIQDVARLGEKLSLDAQLSREEKTKRICMGGTSYCINDIFERANNILDKAVMGSIGIDMDLTWRNKKREYCPIQIHDPYIMLICPVGGDPFQGLTDQEAIDRFIAWEKYQRPIMKIPYVEHLMDSLSGLQIERLTLPELKRKNVEEHKRHREKQKTRSRRRR